MIALCVAAALAAEPVPAAFLRPTLLQEVAPAPPLSPADLERRVQNGLTVGWVGSGMAVGGATAVALGFSEAVRTFTLDGREGSARLYAQMVGGAALLATAPIVRGVGSAQAGRALQASGRGPGPVGGWVAAGLGASALTLGAVGEGPTLSGALYLSSLISGSVHFHRVRYAAGR